MKYFLRWSEKKHCWEMCARPTEAGYEAQIIGHLSLEDVDEIIHIRLFCGSGTGDIKFASPAQDWKELAGGEYKGKTADYVRAREKQRRDETEAARKMRLYGLWRV